MTVRWCPVCGESSDSPHWRPACDKAVEAEQQ